MTFIGVYISKESKKILEEMAEDDKVSIITELETAISDRYRMRYGFTGLEKTKEIEQLRKEFAESIQEDS